MLHLHRSNTSATLADALCALLASPVGGPADEEVVVVPSPGMEAWLQQRIADTLGICAHVRFPFPLRYVPELVATVVAEPSARADVLERVRRWQPATLRWPIWIELRRHLDDPVFAPVAAYLAGAVDPVDRERRLLQLSTTLARAFDRYVRFRPEAVRSWQAGESGGIERGDDDAWQPALWRAVYARLGAADDGAGQHVADFEAALAFSLRLGGVRSEELPKRLFVFGVSTLPPLFVRLLAALAEAIDVHLMVVTPSQEWMEGVVSTSLKLRRELELIDAGRHEHADLLHFEVSPPLLGSFGALGAEFQQVLETELSGTPTREHDHYANPLEHGERHLLAALQHELLTLTPNASDAPDEDPGDLTVEIHRAHNDLRQVQLLQDRLLAALESDPDLDPRDIVVMSPVLDELAPLIDAVFDLPWEDPRRLPYRIADRSERQANPMAEALLRVLELLGGRFGRQAVLDVASLEPARRRLGWSWDDHESYGQALAEVDVRWGFDAQHRARHGHPDDERGSWRAGLDRLLLGAVVPDVPPRLMGGVRPTSLVEGKGVVGLATLDRWLAALEVADDQTASDRTPAAWRAWLTALVDETLEADRETPWHRTRLLEAIDGLFEPWEAVAPDEAVPFGVVRDALVGTLTDERAAHGFLRGGVTFCDMLPMRSVPFRVVALLGVDDGRFPRQDARGGIDLLETSRRIGDRSRRSDDRYLMLEALTSAQDRLIVVHQGFAADTGEPLPASPVVAELQDAIARRFGDDTLRRVCVDHPLHPYSPSHFEPNTKTPSYASDMVAGARALREPVADAAPWFTPPLDPVPRETVELNALSAFLKSPHKAFHRARIGASLDRFDHATDDADPLALDKLSQHRIRELTVWLRQQLGDEAVDIARLEGGLPPGAIGDVLMRPLDLAASAATARFHAELAGRTYGVCDLQHGRLEGRLDTVTPDGTRLLIVPEWSDRRLPSIWCQHLALCASGAGHETVVASADATRRIVCPDDPDALLAGCLETFDRGLTQPLPWVAGAGVAYADARMKKKEPWEAVRNAATMWKRAAEYEADLARLLPELPDEDAFIALAEQLSVLPRRYVSVEQEDA